MSAAGGHVRRLIVAAAAVIAVCAGLAACGGSGAHGAASSTTASTHAAPVSYGFGDSTGLFAQCLPADPHCCDLARAHCDAAQMSGFFDNPLFLKLTRSSSAHPIRTIRLPIEYDAVSDFNGSSTDPGCAPSPQFAREVEVPAHYEILPGEAIDQLIAEVIEAHADGLQPLVVVIGYPERFDRPPGDAPMPDPTTVAGSWDYRCGLRGIVSQLSRLPAAEQPHLWEPLNEPETFPVFDGSTAAPATECRIASRPQPDGPAKAACAQALSQRVIQSMPGHAHDTVIAGDFQFPYTDYLGAFASELARQLPGSSFPATWSIHAYHEITAAYTGVKPSDIAQFDTALGRDTGGAAKSLWITEAATVLSSQAPGGDCPADSINAAGTLGACLDGNQARQAASARVFFSLPSLGHAVPITHLFWYQWKGGPGWDSGLVDAAGVPRAVYCRFYGSGTCHGSANAD